MATVMSAVSVTSFGLLASCAHGQSVAGCKAFNYSHGTLSYQTHTREHALRSMLSYVQQRCQQQLASVKCDANCAEPFEKKTLPDGQAPEGRGAVRT